MFKRLTVLLCLFAFVSADTKAAFISFSTFINSVDVFVTSGQSNDGGGSTLGSSGCAQLPTHLAMFTQAKIWTMRGWEQINPCINTAPYIYDNQFPPGTPLEVWGPELEFAYQYWTTYGRQLYIVKYYQSGTPLANSGPDNWNSLATGSLFDAMQTQVAAALAAITSLNPVVKMHYFVQGESDADVMAFADSYDTNLGAYFSAFRSRIGNANTIILYGLVRNGVFSFANTVRAAQAAHISSTNKLINTDSYPLQADAVHYTAAGQVSLGGDGFTAWQSTLPH